MRIPDAASSAVETDPLLGHWGAWPSQRGRILFLLDGRKAFHEVEDSATVCAPLIRTGFAASVQDKCKDGDGQDGHDAKESHKE
jgi:hypothetical protein